MSTPIPNNPNRPWVEQYRPQNLAQVSHQESVVATLQNAVTTGRLPHLLFYGPPGSGKTSVALALCRQLWDPRTVDWKRRVLELNASDERGISIVRDKIKHFASLTVGGSNTSSKGKKKKKAPKNMFGVPAKAKEEEEEDSVIVMDEEKVDDNTTANDGINYPNPPYKIIILDEADTVTPDAQAALRRIIEAYSKITRFILICNYVTRIIEPLASRCAKFRFQALPPDSMRARLEEICRDQGVSQEFLRTTTKGNQNPKQLVSEEKEDKDLLDTVLHVANGDMRRAVTTLQSANALLGSGDNDENNVMMTPETICEIAGLPTETALQTLLDAVLQPSFDKMQHAVQDVLAQGYSAVVVLQGLLPLLLQCQQLGELHKANIAVAWAQAEFGMVQGADEYLQLLNAGSAAVRGYIESVRQQKQQQGDEMKMAE